ncbi:MAG: 50S ribosomal protein L18 [bacterium]
MSKRTTTENRQLRHKRSRKKIAGSAERPRFCVFISNRHIYAQIINDEDGLTLAAASTLGDDLREQAAGKNMTDKAKLLGSRIAVIAKEAGLSKVCFDKSGYKYGKRLSALADAAREGGLSF